MGNDIGSGVSFESICFYFFSTYVGSFVIGTRTSNGFDVITHYWPILVRNINTVREGSPKYGLCQAMGASKGQLQEAPIRCTGQVQLQIR